MSPTGVELDVPDLAALRREVAGLDRAAVAASFTIRVQRCSATPSLVGHPGWPRLVSLSVATDNGGAVLEADFSDPAPVRAVVAAVARSVAPGALDWPGWPDVSLGERDLVVEDDFPPDLLVSDQAPTDVDPDAPHPVLARPPVIVTTGTEPTWDDGVGEVGGGPLALGPLDERVLNPVGFKRQHRKPVARLVAHEEPDTLGLRTSDGVTPLDARHGPSPADVPGLRRLAGVHLAWEGGGRGPLAYARFVAGLAMAGVPLTSHQVPVWATRVLHPALVEALVQAPTHLDDIVEREAHSIRLRRAALTHHGQAGWRRDVAVGHALQTTPAPRVSVLLATRRPEQVSFALRQVARQRAVDLEVVLVTHGFAAAPADLDSFRAASDAPLTVVEAPADLVFGAVLNLAVSAASGDVLLKMDDDDWYGRDFVFDLLLAGTYSGADVVGTPPEFTFVEPLWLTVRRQDATEAYRPVVAGGTMLMDRGIVAAIGGFRETKKFVDAGLLRAVTDAGGTVYRSHGHGYVLRRGAGGHTWDPGLGYFVGRRLSWHQWRGFCPSPLLDPDDDDRPRKRP